MARRTSFVAMNVVRSPGIAVSSLKNVRRSGVPRVRRMTDRLEAMTYVADMRTGGSARREGLRAVERLQLDDAVAQASSFLARPGI